MRNVTRLLPLALLVLPTASPRPAAADLAASLAVEARSYTGPADAQHLELGGYSGLTPLDTSGTRFVTVTDRGPNVDVGKDKILLFPVPTYNPAIVKLELRDGQLHETGRLLLHLQSGFVDSRTGSASVTGLPNSATADPPAYDASGRNRVGTDPYGLDTEGIALDPHDGSYWICEEYGPNILHVAPDGTILTRLMPSGAAADVPGEDVRAILPAELALRKPNHGLEGIAISPDGTRLFAIMQAPLSNPDKDSGERSRNVRLITLDLSGPEPRVDGMYVYLEQPFGQAGAATQEDVKIGDLAALSASRLLVAERDSADGGGFKMIYQVDLSGATNILGRSDFGRRTLEQLDERDLDRAGVRPLAKSLLLNAADLGWRLEKFEGLAVVDDSTLAIVDDNDFGIAGFDGGRAIPNNVPTRLSVIRLGTPLAR